MSNGLEYTLLFGRYAKGPYAHEKIPGIVSHREMKIKTLMSYHFASTRTSVLRKTAFCWQRGGEIRILIQYWQEYKILQLHWKTVWKFLKRLNILHLGIYPGEMGTYVHAQTSILMFQQCHSYQPKSGKTRMPITYKQINKMGYVHTVEYCSAKKECSTDTSYR